MVRASGLPKGLPGGSDRGMRILFWTMMAGGFLLLTAAKGLAQDDQVKAATAVPLDFPKIGALYDMSFLKEATPSHNLRIAAISTKNPNWVYIEELQFGKTGTAEAGVEHVASHQWVNLTFVVAATELPFPTAAEAGH